MYNTIYDKVRVIVVCDILYIIRMYGLCTRAVLVRTTKHADIDYGAL